MTISNEPICFRDDITIKIDEGGVCFTVSSRDYKGAICIVQNTTGTLSPGAHPGSYNGQDAYNDMFVFNSENRNLQGFESITHNGIQGLQGCNRFDLEGGGVTT